MVEEEGRGGRHRVPSRRGHEAGGVAGPGRHLGVGGVAGRSVHEGQRRRLRAQQRRPQLLHPPHAPQLPLPVLRARQDPRCCAFRSSRDSPLFIPSRKIISRAGSTESSVGPGRAVREVRWIQGGQWGRFGRAT